MCGHAPWYGAERVPSTMPGHAPAQTTASAPATGWTDAELTTSASPHAHPDKAAKVRSMFAAIARSYDLNNRVHSLWRDQAWRRAAVRSVDLKPTDDVLDCACGTGDLSLAFAKAGARSVVGLDFTREMLDYAEIKRDKAAASKVTFVEGDAIQLPFDDASFDVVSIAFGIRNVTEPTQCIAEMFRVLRPGGTLVILEFDQPRFAPMRWFNTLYCAHIMPVTATLISRDTSGAYKYLPRSVSTFMQRESMLANLGSAGFANANAKSLSLGICAMYRADKPM